MDFFLSLLKYVVLCAIQMKKISLTNKSATAKSFAYHRRIIAHCIARAKMDSIIRRRSRQKGEKQQK